MTEKTIYYQPIRPIEHIKFDIVIDNTMKRCPLKSFNGYELEFTFNNKSFKFSYRNRKLRNINNILNFVKRYGTKQDCFEIEKFVFECI